ncbi:DUF1631 family protein [Immundisolibacter sp.]|uniref:DUF1631 family protein n=2 Tax=Immundisolibacter sp. TaxID=1934948 RepID=UPI00356A68B3
MGRSKSSKTDIDAERNSVGDVLASAQQAFMASVRGAFTTMLGKLDDALFDLAQEADGDLERSNYFDAIRELRLGRETIENRFVADLDACWQAVERGEGPGARRESGADRSEVMAFTAAVRRAETDCADALRAVRDGVALAVGIPDGDQILGPRQVFAAFEAACRDTPADPAVRLIVIKFFERHVGVALPEIYRSLAQDLTTPEGALTPLSADATDLPVLEIDRQPNSPFEAPDGGDIDLSALIQRALAGGEAGQGNEALKLLATLQQHDRPGSRSRSASIDLARIATRQVTPPVSDLSQQMVLDMVALLFDSVFTDIAVPVSARLQIARLQIPFLRLALRDRAVLARRSHLGRRFFDQLIAVTRTWREPLLPPQHDVLAALIDSVGESCMDDHRAFAAATESGLADLRSLAMPSGKAIGETESRHQALSARVDAELTQRLAKSGRLPDPVDVFLRSHWRQYLIDCLERYGAEASPWRQALASVDALLWSLVPREGAAAQRLEELRPRLLRQLRQGMDQGGVSMFEQEAFLETLDEIYQRVRAGQSLWDWEEASAIESFMTDGAPKTVSSRGPGKAMDVDPAPKDDEYNGSEEIVSLDDLAAELDLEDAAALDLPGGVAPEAHSDQFHAEDPIGETDEVDLDRGMDVDANDVGDESDHDAELSDESGTDDQISEEPVSDQDKQAGDDRAQASDVEQAPDAEIGSLEALLRRRGLTAAAHEVEEVIITERSGRS